MDEIGLNRDKYARKKHYQKVYKDKHSEESRNVKFCVRALGKTDFSDKQATKHLNKFKHKNDNKSERYRPTVTDYLNKTGTFLQMNVAWDDRNMMGKKENWKIYLNEFARVRKNWEIVPATRVAEELELQFLAKQLTNSTKIADLGCGQASISRTLNQYCKIDSYDIHTETNDGSVTIADIEHIPKPKGYYDICIMCLSLLGKYKNKLREVFRLCKAGGQIILWHPKSVSEKLLTKLRDFKPLIREIEVKNQDRFVEINIKRSRA